MKTTKFIGLIALAAVITLAFAACEQPADPSKGKTVTVTFNPNGGNWDGSTKSKTAKNTAVVGNPIAAPVRERMTVDGWYTEPNGGDKWDFDTLITEDKTLYARWDILPLTLIADISVYFEGAVNGIMGYTGTATVDDPAPLPVKIDLGTMNEADSGWANLLAAIATEGKYVALDLSTSTMTDTKFNNPDAKTGKDKIVSLTLPTAATSIPYAIWDDVAETLTNGFPDYDNLKEFTGKNIASINWNTFLDCTSLTTVDFPGATTIGIGAFSGCTSLTTVDFPEATSIGLSAFLDCTSLASVVFPKVTSIGEGAFERCTSLTAVDFPGATTIDQYTFYGCTSLTTVSFPEATSIGREAFRDCASLASVSFPKVTSIDYGAFSNCESITSITIAADVTIEAQGSRFAHFVTYYGIADKAAGTYVYDTSTEQWSKQE